MAFILIWILVNAEGSVLQTNGEWTKEGYTNAKTFAKKVANVAELFQLNPEAASAYEVFKRRNTWVQNNNRVVHKPKK